MRAHLVRIEQNSRIEERFPSGYDLPLPSRKMEDGVKTGTKPKKSGFSTGESSSFTREI
jgi:hypothetical protein